MISIKNIVKDYQAGDNVVHALKDININFRKSEFVSILGPSGCGKTTLLNIIGGLDKYTSGDIVVNGRSTKEFKDKDWDAYRSQYIGFVFQSYNLIPHLNVLENVELALTIAGVNKKERRQKAIHALERVGLKEQLKKRPNQLSGGQMQRVAIARAIVNEPQVILADEPTGALDSETSIQVMDILKEISKTCLVIMVTHNDALADKYSTRIIKLLDGKLINDSKPYTPNDTEVKADNKKIKSSMSIFTAFTLSFKNLWSKKLKTFITAFAGSIGIIGIALVLSVSTGLNHYITSMQQETLSSYPISVSMVSINYDAFTNVMTGGTMQERQDYPDDYKLNIYSTSNIILTMGLGKFNYIGKEFTDYVNDYCDKEMNKENGAVSLIKYEYATDLKLVTKVGDNIVQPKTKTILSSMSGSADSLFSVGISNKDLILENYDVLGNGHYPENKNELALVVNKYNSMSEQDFVDMGLGSKATMGATYEPIDLNTIVGQRTYQLIYNDDYYLEDSEGNFSEQTDLTALFNASNTAEQTLTISCVLRQKQDSKMTILNEGIMYLPELAESYKTNCQASNIVAKTTDSLKIPFSVNVSELNQYLNAGDMYTFEAGTPIATVKQYVLDNFKMTLTDEQVRDLVLQSVGASDVPTGLHIYPSSFDGKKDIIKMIDNWNASPAGQNAKITITDSTEFLTKTLGQLIDIVSYVLVAFSAISLVVSSIMIGIITYTSVIERTKEIGVLRSVGARKKDISRVFNCETFIVGISAGLLGVLIAWALTFPISAIIKNVAGGTITTSMAILTWQASLALVAISTLLTLVAGLIPARIAAKKDPVKALRTE